MFSILADPRCALQATIRVRSPWIAHVWCDGVFGVLSRAARVSPAWSTANAEGVPLDDAARVTSREPLFNDTSLRSVLVIKNHIAGLYLSERAKNAAVVLGMKGPKRLQIRPSHSMSADAFIHTSNDGVHRNQTEIQIQRPVDRLAQLEDATCQIGPIKRGDTINFGYALDAGTTTNTNGAVRTKAIPGEDSYQAVLSIFIGDNPVDRELKNGLLGSQQSDDRHSGISPIAAWLVLAVVLFNRSL